MATTKSNQFHLIPDLDIAAITFSTFERIEAAAITTGIAISKAVSMIHVWAARSNDRRQLALMSSRMLIDIGLSPADVASESNKFFWQK
jgi:uncharacterized protein YjiS (DUF1127 family)